MSSLLHGEPILAVEVTNISAFGFWLLVDEQEHFLPFSQFPWFAQATVAAILDVQQPAPGHLYWPALDVDLHMNSILRPQDYPLVYKD